MLRLLCITAHPDDEAGAFGGTLLLYGERGVETHVVCLTAGTAARNRGPARSEQELAEMRTRELAASCKLLGVSHWEVLGYPDAQLDRVNLVSVTGELVRRIREIRPQVVITFGPDGGLTGHPDHAMAGVFATMAFQWAAQPVRFPEQGLASHAAQKLYYHTAGFKLKGRQPTAQPPVTARIDVGERRFEKKFEAFEQHTTQAPLFERVRKNLGQPPFVEMYHLACTREPSDLELEIDLLQGVRQ